MTGAADAAGAGGSSGSTSLLIGAAGGYAVHGDRPLVAGVSAGQSECHDVDSGTLCRIPVWAKLPPVAAAR